MKNNDKYIVKGKWFRYIALLLPFAAIVNFLFPFIIRRWVNKKLALLKGHSGQVDAIGISTRTITVHYFLLDKIVEETNAPHKYITVDKLTIHFSLKSLFNGKVGCSIIIDAPTFRYTNTAKVKVKKRRNPNKPVVTLNTLFPFLIDELIIKNGSAEYYDTTVKPYVYVEATKVYVTAKNLGGKTYIENQLPTDISFIATAYNGKLNGVAKVNLLSPKPTFDANLEIKEFDLLGLNSFFNAYGKFNVKTGKFGLFTEVAAKEGKFAGYAKPLITNLKVEGTGHEEKTFWRSVWESIINVSVKVLENPKAEQIATKIPFEGQFKETDVNVWYAIAQTFRNAFIAALTPSIDYEINLGSVDEVPTIGKGSKTSL